MALTCLKGGTECGNNRVKTPIYATPAVEGLKIIIIIIIMIINMI